jgi:hypothetical protein
MFVGTAGANPRVEHLKGASLRYDPTVPANIRLGWKGLPGTNAILFGKSTNDGWYYWTHNLC